MVSREQLQRWGLLTSKPLPERLLPWPFYAVLALVSLVLGVLAVRGVGFDYPDRARIVGLAVLMPCSVAMAGAAVLSRRLRPRRGNRRRRGAA